MKRIILNILLALIVTATVISASTAITVMFRPLYYMDIEHLNISENSGIPEELCRENYDVLIDYNLIGGDDVLVFPTLKMSEQGRIHFAEVKNIFIGMQWIAILGILLAGFRFFYQKKVGNRDFSWLRISSYLLLAAVVMVGAAVAIDWEWAFVTMHGLLFDNDYWIFDAATDPVIKILPEEFFMHCGIMILALVFVFLGIIQIIFKKNHRKRQV